MSLHIHNILPQFFWDHVIAHLTLADTSKLFLNVPKATRHYHCLVNTHERLAQVANYATCITLGKETVTTLQVFEKLWDLNETPAERHPTPRLAKLIASYNSIKTVEFAHCFARLQHLELSCCRLSIIHPLHDLHNLTYLDASHNSIKNVSFLAKMAKLTHLNLADNLLSTTEGLGGLAYLEHLNLSDNYIKRLELHCAALVTLLATSNRLEWISVSATCPRLRVLHIDCHEERMIKLISDCNLAELRTGIGSCGDISSLARMTTLTSLDMSRSFITDIAPLKKLVLLVSLDLSNNCNIRDLSSLAELTRLRDLKLACNDLRTVDDIQALLSMTCLTRLDLSFNRVCSDHRFVSMLRQIRKNNPHLIKLLPEIPTAPSQ